ncbi:uncharacterized protein LOC122790793 isoform X1 [Protopterus annectens]|uniref:uncharacterized protein LOC122790793 isoform X1 n=1 Tax=Protopterus annectens TaxID=7888 RepID=UPI001CFBFDF1|nr:uncharacterized protein LOC122790793 isoform X1 [Protopterus annectens]
MLSSELIEILSRGNTFVPSSNFDLTKTIIDLKCYVRKLNLDLLFNNSISVPKSELKTPSTFNPPLHTVLKVFENVCELDLRDIKNDVRPNNSQNITKEQRRALSDFKLLPVRAIKPDKGGGLVIFNNSMYNDKMSSVLDTSAYCLSSTNEMNVTYRRIRGYLRDMFLEGKIDVELYNFLDISFPKVPMMFGIPKIHKNLENPPMRALIDGRFSMTHNSAKLIDHILLKYLKKIPSICKDSWTFLSNISEVTFNTDFNFLTIDVVDLYTSIPHQEATEWVGMKLKDLGATNNEINIVTELLGIVLESNFFIFNEEIFLQKQGVAMGSPCGASVANIFMAFWEHKYILSNSTFNEQLRLYTRYLDDIFILFKGNATEADVLVDYMNHTTKFLKFTHCFSVQEIDYLDVNLNKDDISRTYMSKVFRKTTYCNSILHFTSQHPFKQKKAIIKGQLVRAVCMCNSSSAFGQECSFLKNQFLNRGYPVTLIDEIITEIEVKRSVGFYKPLLKVIDELMIDTIQLDFNSVVEDGTQPSVNIRIDNLVKANLFTSFITAFSNDAGKICNILTKNWQFIRNDSLLFEKLGPFPRVVFKKGRNLKELLQSRQKLQFFKCKGSTTCGTCSWCHLVRVGLSFSVNDIKYDIQHTINWNSKSVIYGAFCNACPAFYIGKTDRKLRQRIYEHVYAMRTNKQENALARHVANFPDHKFSFMGIDHIPMSIRGGPLSLLLEFRELEWQIKLNAFHSPGLNDNCNISVVLKMRSYIK